jgi:hypothetical protein
MGITELQAFLSRQGQLSDPESLYVLSHLALQGDYLKKMILLVIVLCLTVLSLSGITSAADAKSPEDQFLNSYQGNLSLKKIVSIDLLSVMGLPAYFIAEAVKFKAPKPGWKLNTVQILGWDGYNGTEESIPRERMIALEVRDKDLNLLYKFADSQLPYSNFVRNATETYPFTMHLPSIPVSDEFFVCFYDRGAIAVATEVLNKTSDNSFIYVSEGNVLLPSNLPLFRQNESVPLNWIMTVSGN